MSDQPRMRVSCALNCIAKQRAVDVWDDMEIDDDATPQSVARTTLLSWYEEREGHLVPVVSSDEDIPDEVIVRTPDGKQVLARWTIVDEITARFEQGCFT